MMIVPVKPIANQTLQVQLAGQACAIDLQQTSGGLFMGLSVDSALVIGGVICENLNRIVRNAYLGFDGDFCFVDTEGSADPDYAGLGSRFVLIYLERADLPAAET